MARRYTALYVNVVLRGCGVPDPPAISFAHSLGLTATAVGSTRARSKSCIGPEKAKAALVPQDGFRLRLAQVWAHPERRTDRMRVELSITRDRASA